jgi:hypothetical protein
MLAVNNMTGNAEISAKGAYAIGNGGAGAGGRIKFYYFQWFDQSAYPINDESLNYGI